MIKQGHEPVDLIVMVNETVDRFNFHGANPAMLKRYSEAWNLPMITCPADGESYPSAFESGLTKAKATGAKAAYFSDIDIENNR
ncbi:MAG: hypothetical protein HFH49_10530 [Lachnospiraceae bacterium]|nr:hypothetical protein [Lachnospiraceae bacterium]